MTQAIEFSNACFVIISFGTIFLSKRFFIALPDLMQSFSLALDAASWLLLPGKLIPNASIADAMVLAVYIPPHEPGPLTEISSILISSSSEMSPLANSPVFSKTDT